jgi:hypothetical protein
VSKADQIRRHRPHRVLTRVAPPRPLPERNPWSPTADKLWHGTHGTVFAAGSGSACTNAARCFGSLQVPVVRPGDAARPALSSPMRSKALRRKIVWRAYLVVKPSAFRRTAQLDSPGCHRRTGVFVTAESPTGRPPRRQPACGRSDCEPGVTGSRMPDTRNKATSCESECRERELYL